MVAPQSSSVPTPRITEGQACIGAFPQSLGRAGKTGRQGLSESARAMEAPQGARRPCQGARPTLQIRSPAPVGGGFGSERREHMAGSLTGRGCALGAVTRKPGSAEGLGSLCPPWISWSLPFRWQLRQSGPGASVRVELPTLPGVAGVGGGGGKTTPVAPAGGLGVARPTGFPPPTQLPVVAITVLAP